MDAPLGRRNRAVRELRQLLRDPRLRRTTGAAVAEGPRVVDAALAGGLVEALYVDAAALTRYATLRPGVDVLVLADGVADVISDVRTSQGVFARIRRPVVEADEVLASASLCCVALEVSDPGNAGTLIRSAVAFGADAIVFGPHSVDAYNPKTLRASAGAAFAIPIIESDMEIRSVLERLRRRGVVVLGARGDATPASSLDLTRPTAIVLGHEVRGLPDDLPLDGGVSVPITSAVESLNVAMAGTALLYEAARQRDAR